MKTRYTYSLPVSEGLMNDERGFGDNLIASLSCFAMFPISMHEPIRLIQGLMANYYC